MRTLLIDGDTLLYAASSSTERPIQWSEWLWTLHSDFDDAIAKLDAELDRISETLKADRMIVALSDELRWRPEVMPAYKFNRAGGRKPLTYGPLRKYVHDTRETYQRPKLEGDDVLGILGTHPSIVPGEKIIVAIDKDMRTIPGEHYHYDRDEQYTVTLKDADYFFYTQVLTGDPTDGYPGCPGIGPKKAEKILGPLFEAEDWGIESVWPAIVATYQNAGLSEEVALMNARVARICRHTDWNFEDKEVILWNPTQQG